MRSHYQNPPVQTSAESNGANKQLPEHEGQESDRTIQLKRSHKTSNHIKFNNQNKTPHQIKQNKIKNKIK